MEKNPIFKQYTSIDANILNNGLYGLNSVRYLTQSISSDCTIL